MYDIKHIIFYGSLMSNMGTRPILKIEDQVQLLGSCKMKGWLYDLGRYPGLKLGGSNFVKGELYEILKADCLPVLDEFEGFIPNNLIDSWYVRRKIWVSDFELEAWVYEFNESIEGKVLVKGGDWREYYSGESYKGDKPIR